MLPAIYSGKHNKDIDEIISTRNISKERLLPKNKGG